MIILFTIIVLPRIFVYDDTLNMLNTIPCIFYPFVKPISLYQRYMYQTYVTESLGRPFDTGFWFPDIIVFFRVFY
jgi:hypothetical protein